MIIAMIAYHLCWDLSYFRFIAADVGYDPQWVVIARTILSVFLFLVGVGLVLGHGRTIRWRAFWKRWVFVAAGALIITIATWFAFPDSFVYFGVLHAIALFSLMALPFLRAPLWLVGPVAIAVIGAHFAYADPLFNAKTRSVLGFWTVPPPPMIWSPSSPGSASCYSVSSPPACCWPPRWPTSWLRSSPKPPRHHAGGRGPLEPSDLSAASAAAARRAVPAGLGNPSRNRHAISRFPQILPADLHHGRHQRPALRHLLPMRPRRRRKQRFVERHLYRPSHRRRAGATRCQ
ncbi:DUF1624 domain-containing protein [Devosia sp. A8/3-2]|nr:DUF1624 domain-containing protein [Devosia sp. A8/3-2]